MCASDKNWKFCSDAFMVYMYLKLQQNAWQYKKTAKSIPAWAGYLKNVAADLDISLHKISRIISWLKSENIVLPVYGVKEKNGEKISKTIIIFLLCCDEQNICSVIASAKDAIKTSNPTARWYPAGHVVKDTDSIDEAALDVVCDEDELY